MIRPAPWLLLLACLIATASAAFATAPQAKKSHILGEPLNRDEDATIQLRIRPVGHSIELTWNANPNAIDWFVVRAFDPNLADAETLLATTATTWTDTDILLQNHATAFYWVIPHLPVLPPHHEDIVEDFDYNPVFTSYADQDAEPDSFQLVEGGARYPNGHALELDGNTWKQESITPFHIGTGGTWRLAIKLFGRGELTAFGMADSANEMWYTFAGWEERASEAWVQTYQGWFPADSAWHWVDLCVGDEWYSHFGYFPNINRLMYANDNDADTSACSWQIDEIRDITGALSYPPNAGFSWEIVAHPTQDSIDVRFDPFTYDPDNNLAYIRWDFGDSTFSNAANPIHRYRAHHSYSAVQTVADSTGRMDWAMQHVEDMPSTSSHQITAMFTGDVMMARRYEDDGGIIQTFGVDSIFGRAQSLLSSVDFASCNLECTFTTDTNHHPTKSIYFKGRPEYLPALNFAGFDYVNLANNHSFDYMLGGQHETIHWLDSLKILHTGAGDDEDQAREPLFFSENGLCVAVLGFCNRDGTEDNAQPYLAAGQSRPGFAMWDRAAIEEMIPRVRAVADVVIVQVHSGIEYATEPPTASDGHSLDMTGWDDDDPVLELIPDTSDVALRRYAIQMGADLVINHHPHVLQGVEMYNGKLIAHSLGNFAFDQTFPETFLTFGLETRLSPSGADSFVVHPVYIDRYIPTPASGELAQAILDYESELSRPMGTWVVRDPDGATATILPDTNYTRMFADYTDTLTLIDQDTVAAVSAPFKLQGTGYLTQVTISSPDSAQIRVGHDDIMWGNMEDEGSTPWNLNSAYEHYDNVDYLRGARSIRLNRSGGGTNSVSTNFLYRKIYHTDHAATITGWLRGENARDAKLQFEFWNARTGGDLVGSITPGGLFQGTFPWTNVWQDLVWPQDGWLYSVTLALRSPVTGAGIAWFDDVSLVEWQGWQSGTTNLPFPGEMNWVQAHAPLGTTQVIVNYRREWVQLP